MCRGTGDGGFCIPQLWPSIHEVEHLGGVQQLFELAEELDALVVSAFGVHQDQQGAGAPGRGGLPEAWWGRNDKKEMLLLSELLE